MMTTGGGGGGGGIGGQLNMEWSEGDLVWFDPNLGHPLPGEIQEVHRAAQVIVVQALINGKVIIFFRIHRFLYEVIVKQTLLRSQRFI